MPWRADHFNGSERVRASGEDKGTKFFFRSWSRKVGPVWDQHSKLVPRPARPQSGETLESWKRPRGSESEERRLGAACSALGAFVGCSGEQACWRRPGRRRWRG